MHDDLRLRRATVADKEALAAFDMAVHARADNPQSSAYLDRYVRDLFERPHPLIAVDDHLLLVDDATGEIASTVQLISQTWTYDGIPFSVGQIELVGTAPAYRRRGLVRRLIDEAHRVSAARGELVQVIGGKPWFYRQFGYEYAIELGGGRLLRRASVPALPEGEAEPVRLRPATLEDAPLLALIDAAAPPRERVRCPRDEALWRYELDGRSHDNLFRYQIHILEAANRGAIGYLAFTPSTRRGARVRVAACELLPEASWLAVAPAVLRHLDAFGAAHDWGAGITFEGTYLALGSAHPLYEALASHVAWADAPHAFYVRVADLPAFVRHIAPALEQRLGQSAAAGYSGSLDLSFYRGGLRLVFSRGRLEARAWEPSDVVPGDAAFPGLTFLQLLFGFRGLPDLVHAFPDCEVQNDAARALLTALFPPEPSRVWSIV